MRLNKYKQPFNKNALQNKIVAIFFEAFLKLQNPSDKHKNYFYWGLGFLLVSRSSGLIFRLVVQFLYVYLRFHGPRFRFLNFGSNGQRVTPTQPPGNTRYFQVDDIFICHILDILIVILTKKECMYKLFYYLNFNYLII